MDLQRTQCINFGATRVLAAYNKENVIDVLKLNINDKSDIRFAKNFLKHYQKNINVEIQLKILKCRESQSFKSFLTIF